MKKIRFSLSSKGKGFILTECHYEILSHLIHRYFNNKNQINIQIIKNKFLKKMNSFPKKNLDPHEVIFHFIFSKKNFNPS